ncbi:hypothetical protein LIER_31606 [Lithospermum erythrorhizon]|uniref:Uncharacterized protein n=1 Tax=Lithospermum erythrorhizon TaxID=34254 RepID=A0AAV3RRK2_LITER
MCQRLFASQELLFSKTVEFSPRSPPLTQSNDGAETSKAFQREAYESLHYLLAESGIEKMMSLPRSHITCEFSRLWVQAATAAQALTEYGATKEDEVDRLEAILVREDSRVCHLWESVKELEAQLSSAYQELSRSAVHAQQVVEAREEKAVALLASQMTEAEVERLTKLVVDLQSQRLSAGPPFRWSNAGAILTDFVLNLQEQVLSLPSFLEAYN